MRLPDSRVPQPAFKWELAMGKVWSTGEERAENFALNIDIMAKLIGEWKIPKKIGGYIV